VAIRSGGGAARPVLPVVLVATSGLAWRGPSRVVRPYPANGMVAEAPLPTLCVVELPTPLHSGDVIG